MITGVVATGLIFATCALVAMLDQDGLTLKDGLVCAGTAVAGGIGVGVAVTATSAGGVALAAAIIAGLTTGIWLNKDIRDR